MSTDQPQRTRWSRRQLLTAGAACAASLAPMLARGAGSEFPSHPLTLIVPYPPGGSNDVFARLVGAQLSRRFQQPVVVENRPGAGGLIGLGALSRAQPDGHTLALASSSFATSAAVQQRLPFDPVKDFEPVARISVNPLLVVASPALGVRNLSDLIAMARRRPGRVTYGSSGVGSANHFAAELFSSAAGVRLVHVPYRGMAPALADLAGGHLDMVITSLASAHPFLVDAKVVPLVTTGHKRFAAWPAIPTCEEAGLAGFAVDGWAGFLAPGRTPTAVVESLNAAINEAMAAAEVVKALAIDGSSFEPMSAAAFKTAVHRDLERWRSIAKAQEIKAD